MVHLIALVRVRNIALMTQYRKTVISSLEDYGGKVAFESSKVFTLDDENRLGDFSDCIVYTFPSEALAYAWYESDSYELELNDRQKAADMTLIGCVKN